jgi:hypothetical protein
MQGLTQFRGIRFKPEMDSRILRAAKAEGVDYSTFIRRAAIERARKYERRQKPEENGNDSK